MKNFHRKAICYEQLLVERSGTYKFYYVFLTLEAIGIIGSDDLIEN